MTAPAVPDVQVDAELAEAIDRAPRCMFRSSFHTGERCANTAEWVARPRPVCCLNAADLICNEHKQLFDFQGVECVKCGKPLAVAWERL